MKKSCLYLGLCGLTFFTQTAFAQPPEAELALGIGLASFQDPQKGLDAKQVVLPLVSYRGERLNFQVTTLSYKLVELGDVEINALVSGRIQGYEAIDSPYLRGMKTRSDTLDGGISLDWNGFSLSYKHDLFSKYKGDEVALSYSKGFDLGKLQLMTGAGVTWQSEKLNHYYFGVNTSEAQNLVVQGSLFNRTHYQVEAALVPEVNALAIYSLSKSWALIGGAEVEFLPEEITDSPIIGEKNSWGAFIGLARNF
ncbi:MAG TPA: MipA/OmpV family protein [Cellvibrio sp.]|nr:MipA/OmpV family protein [Cellvibrio sp.]